MLFSLEFDVSKSIYVKLSALLCFDYFLIVFAIKTHTFNSLFFIKIIMLCIFYLTVVLMKIINIAQGRVVYVCKLTIKKTLGII